MEAQFEPTSDPDSLPTELLLLPLPPPPLTAAARSRRRPCLAHAPPPPLPRTRTAAAPASHTHRRRPCLAHAPPPPLPRTRTAAAPASHTHRRRPCLAHTPPLAARCSLLRRTCRTWSPSATNIMVDMRIFRPSVWAPLGSLVKIKDRRIFHNCYNFPIFLRESFGVIFSNKIGDS
jgi:hypothetical protein